MNDHISEQQLEEQRYRVLIDHAPEPVLILDAALKRFVDANPMASEVLGYSKTEFCAVGPAEISPPHQDGVPTEEWAEQNIKLALQGANPSFEWVHCTKTGDEIPMEIRLIRFPPYHKSLIRCSLVDLTEKKAMENALQDTQERLRLALTVSGCGCYDWYPSTGQLHWDERMHELHGLALDAEIDRNDHFFSVLHEDDRERILGNFTAVLSPNSDVNSYEDEYRIVVHGKVQYIVSQGITIRNDNGEVIRIIGTNRDVTTEREREALITSTTERLEQAQQLASIGSFETDLVEMKTWWSEGLYRIREVSPEDFTPSCSAFIDMIYPEDRAAVKERVEICKAGGGEQRLAYRLLLNNNQTKYVEDVFHGVKDKTGQVVRVIGTSQDVTERKLMEDALRQSKDYAENLIETANVMVIGLDSVGRVTIFNHAAQKLTGYTQEELAGKNWFETLVPRERFPEVWESFQEIEQRGVQRVYENPILTKSGEERIISWQNSALEDEGEMIGTISFGMDITEHRRAIKALEEREELFRSVFDQQFQFMGILTEEGRILEINDLPLKMMGVKREELIGKFIWEAPSWAELPEQQAVLKGRLEEARNSNGIIFGEGAFYDLNHKLRWANSSFTAVRDEHQNIRYILVQATDVTEQREMEEALRRAKNFAESLIDTANVMVIGLDPLGEVTIFNKGAEQISGYTQKDLEGENWYENLIPEERYPEAREIFKKLREGEFPRTYEGSIITKSGESRMITWQNSTVEYRGEVLGSISFGVDITERLRALAALREREDLFRTVFDQQFQFICILSEDGRFLEVNSLPLRVMGGTREDYLGHFFWEAPCWAELPEWREIIKGRLVRARKSTHTFLTLDGFHDIYKNMCWADTAYTAIRDEEQNIRFILVQATDITERKAAQEQLQQAQEELSELTDRFRISTKAAEIGIWEWRIAENKLIWDETMRRIYKLEDQQTSDSMQDWESYLNSNDLYRFRTWVSDLLFDRHQKSIEFQIRHFTEQPQFIKAVAIVERDEYQQPIRMIGTNLDITQEKEAEQQRMRAKQLEVRNNELEQFAYVASHDLQEPLRTVTSFVGLLESRYQDKLDAEANQYINFIVSAATRMSQLITGLLEYARIGTEGKLGKVNTTALVQAVLQDLSAQITETAANFQVDDLPTVTGYETELRVLFQNLVSNSLKFCKPDVAPQITIEAKREKRATIFSISDNGIGIEPHYQQQIFVIFKRLHRREQFAGTGIGLAHCQKIVELHGGTIWVESEVGEGSTFYFSIQDQTPV